MDGIILIDKSAGTSSQTVDRLMKRALNVKKVGHVGTLDPFATGLLPLAVGRGTAVIRYMDSYDKSYEFRCRLGRSTDTYDRDGQTTAVQALDKDRVEQLLADGGALLQRAAQSLEQITEQFPPAYSAVKMAGKRLYEYARAGLPMPELKARSIKVYDLVFLGAAYDPEGDPEAPLYVDLRLSCTKGTYIRSLCVSLGENLGLPAYAESLRRTATGPYDVAAALNFELLMEEFRADPSGFAEKFCREAKILPIESALPDYDMIEFSLRDADSLLCGRTVELSAYREQLASSVASTLAEASGRRFLATAANGLLGMVNIQKTAMNEYIFKAERMFTDRAIYFAK